MDRLKSASHPSPSLALGWRQHVVRPSGRASTITWGLGLLLVTAIGTLPAAAAPVVPATTTGNETTPPAPVTDRAGTNGPERAAQGAAPRPHIVFFLIDDLGYADCGFNGGTEIRTPHIDRLARAGAILEAHYVQPVCSPTRAALMTGRYPTRTGVYTIVRPHAKWGLPLKERTLAQVLRDAGYWTGIAGKWHLGEFERPYLPTQRGFDRQYGHYFGAIDYFTHLRDGTRDWYRDDQPCGDEGYSTHLVAAEVCRWIRDRPAGQPMFLYVPFNGVHSPMQVPDSYLKPYGELTGARQKLAGMLAAVDEAIGQIVAAIDAAGLRQQTLFVFSSDNGGPRPGVNTPWRNYKGTLEEGGIRAAAFAQWSGQIPPGQRIAQPMHIIDWLPTLARLAGAVLDPQIPIDGRDVWPMLTQQARTPHEHLFFIQSPTNAAVRAGDWKLKWTASRPADRAEQKPSATKKAKAKANTEPVPSSTKPEVQSRPRGQGGVAAQPGTVVMYHLPSDPQEEKDRATEEPERAARLQAALFRMLQDAVPARTDSDQN